MNYIKKNILILGFTATFIGCSQSATSVFNKDASYGQNIQYSKILKSIEKDDVNAIFNLTYLNSSDSNKWDNGKQNFLIGTYVFDTIDNDFELTMNGQKQISSQEISKENPLYKDIAFRNSWAKYNIVTFNNDNNSTLTIQYTHPKLNTISETFIKE